MAVNTVNSMCLIDTRVEDEIEKLSVSGVTEVLSFGREVR